MLAGISHTMAAIITTPIDEVVEDFCIDHMLPEEDCPNTDDEIPSAQLASFLKLMELPEDFPVNYNGATRDDLVVTLKTTYNLLSKETYYVV